MGLCEEKAKMIWGNFSLSFLHLLSSFSLESFLSATSCPVPCFVPVSWSSLSSFNPALDHILRHIPVSPFLFYGGGERVKRTRKRQEWREEEIIRLSSSVQFLLLMLVLPFLISLVPFLTSLPKPSSRLVSSFLPLILHPSFFSSSPVSFLIHVLREKDSTFSLTRHTRSMDCIFVL